MRSSIDGGTNITIILIDLWEMARGSSISCNVLRQSLRLSTDNVYKTERLVWKQTPKTAILASWDYEKLRTDEFGICCPALFGDAHIDLHVLRRDLESSCKLEDSPFADGIGCTEAIFKVVRILMDDLGMKPGTMTTLHLGLMLLASPTSNAQLWRIAISGGIAPSPFVD